MLKHPMVRLVAVASLWIACCAVGFAADQQAFDPRPGEAEFKRRDGNEDKYLSGTEIQGLEKYDADGNGRLTREEYLGGLSREQFPAPAEESEPTIVTVADAKPFTMGRDELLRLEARGIAGSQMTAELSGPIKLKRTAYLRQLKGGQMLIGGSIAEFEIEPTGEGEATVTTTVTYPTTPDAKKTTYRFTIGPALN